MRLIVILLLMTSGFTARSQERVVISPEKPEPGQTVTVTLDPSVPGGPIPAGAAGVTLQFVNSNLYDLPYTMPLKKEGGKWTISFQLAPYAAFCTFKLMSGEITERPSADRLFEMVVYKNGSPCAMRFTTRAAACLTRWGNP